MNPVGRKMWANGWNIKKWSKSRGFNYNTVTKVVRKERGMWMAGVSRHIMDALVQDGYATTEYFGLEDGQ